MAKGLPYLKFRPDMWMLGNISFEEMNIQGLYLNICALYWHRDGVLDLDEITKRFKNYSELIPEITKRFLNIDDTGKINIKWLDEQLEERSIVSYVNSGNGSKGGRPKGSKKQGGKPNANRDKSEPLTEKTQKKRKEESIIEEKKEKKKKDLEARKNSFALTLKPFLGNGEGKYDRKFLNDFLKYWTEPNKSGTKFRQETEGHWDLARRLETWAKNDKSFGKPTVDPSKSPEKSSLTFS